MTGKTRSLEHDCGDRVDCATQALPLPVDSLRWRCDLDDLPFESTLDVEPVSGVVGQDAAVEALRFGLETNAPGQNVFVRGLSGTGRSTLVRRLLEEIRLSCPMTKGCCYVHNFAQPERPRLIILPAGRGRDFRQYIDRLADFIRDDLGNALSSEGIDAQRTLHAQTTERRLSEVVDPFEQLLKVAGLTLVSVEAGSVVQTAIFPLVDGRAVAPEAFDQMHARGEITDTHYKEARDNYVKFDKQLGAVSEKTDTIRREHDEAVAELLGTTARSVLDKIVGEIRKRFDLKSVNEFLNELVDDAISRLLTGGDDEADYTRLYHVNVVLEHKGNGACPIIVENAPTARNLLGTIDFDTQAVDETYPRHMGIRAGSLLRADGGYLILEDRDLLEEPDAWKVLKRALRTGRVEIVPPEGVFPGAAPLLKPEPIDLNIKVILIGDPNSYMALDEHDPEFPHLFKVLADFDTTIPREAEGVQHYAAVVARIAKEEGLPAFEQSAIAALVEHGARIAATNAKLTARFGRIADIAREAAFVARARNAKTVCGNDVNDAVRRGRKRADLPSRRFRELVADGTIRIDTGGSVVGQINGLAVLQAGPIVYGFPMRISATIGPGTAGVINIEQEAALSGSIHTKGFYILGGLMRYLLRTDHPLAFDASIAFEQSYGSIDGDSASGAEFCCLLSALTDLPLRQDFAMTGAIDQMGHILAVGAVNEKIEGFFDACHDLKDKGKHGVIIPRSNAGDLMLREDVVEACSEGRFAVYTVDTVHDALALLTGKSTGTRNGKAGYPQRSMLGLAVQNAKDLWLKAARPNNPWSKSATVKSPPE